MIPDDLFTSEKGERKWDCKREGVKGEERKGESKRGKEWEKEMEK